MPPAMTAPRSASRLLLWPVGVVAVVVAFVLKDQAWDGAVLAGLMLLIILFPAFFHQSILQQPVDLDVLEVVAVGFVAKFSAIDIGA